MAAARRFVFVENTKAGGEQLMLANLDPVSLRFTATAQIIAQMGAVPGDMPTDGSLPEFYVTIAVRPDNAFAAVWSAQIGNDFVDWNVGIYDMETGAGTVHFNEHSLNRVNRANCPCPLFDAFLASEVALETPQSQLDSYDYSVVVEGANVGQPSLQWSATGTLIATFGFDVLVTGLIPLGQDQFAFEVAPTTGPGGTLDILSRNAGVAPYSPLPANSFALHPMPERILPAPPLIIYHGKRPVQFFPWFWKWFPRWLRNRLPGSGYRPAKNVEGFVV